MRLSLIIVCSILNISLVFGQSASLKGQVFDPSGASVPGAVVMLTSPSGQVQTTTANNTGSYSFANLPVGDYSVLASAPSLEQQPISVALKTGVQTLRLELKVAVNQQQTTVQAEAESAVSTEASSNASALVLRGKDLQALADDPEDLQADLQALAGPSAGPGVRLFLHRRLQRRTDAFEGRHS